MVHLSEEQMFIAVGQFVDDLVKIVRPQNLLFLAVDGPAPRAKMNQQRQRRFRAAKELSKALKESELKGEEVPLDPFDSNCITPGTTFMSRLTTFLDYYISKKIRDDSNWRTPQIILSGAEVPGEGEHKIMEYIRCKPSSLMILSWSSLLCFISTGGTKARTRGLQTFATASMATTRILSCWHWLPTNLTSPY